MEFKYDHINFPSPLLVESFGESDHKVEDAINDILDNSLDADASRINIYIEKSDTGKNVKIGNKICISDDGNGMDFDQALQCLKMGSSNKSSNSKLAGRYGLGLKTASLSLGRSITILTKKIDGKLIIVNQDLDIIRNTGQWSLCCMDVESLSFNDMFKLQHQWNTFGVNQEHGTLIIIEKLKEKRLPSFVETLENRLKESIGLVQGKFIRTGKRFFINDEIVLENDPFRNGLKVESASDNLLFNGHKLKVSFWEIPEGNMETQGFYCYRNDRLIGNPIWLGLYKKHNCRNNIRIELEFDSNLDYEMGLSFTKISVDPSDLIKNELKKLCGPKLIKLKKESDEEKASKSQEADNVLNDVMEEAKVYESQFNGLPTKKTEISDSLQPPATSDSIDDVPEVTKTKEDDTPLSEDIPSITEPKPSTSSHKHGYKDPKINIINMHMHETADLFVTDWNNDGMREIQCNVDHPKFKYHDKTGTLDIYYYDILSYGRAWIAFEELADESKEYDRAKKSKYQFLQDVSDNLRVIYKDKLQKLIEQIETGD